MPAGELPIFCLPAYFLNIAFQPAARTLFRQPFQLIFRTAFPSVSFVIGLHTTTCLTAKFHPALAMIYQETPAMIADCLREFGVIVTV